MSWQSAALAILREHRIENLERLVETRGESFDRIFALGRALLRRGATPPWIIEGARIGWGSRGVIRLGPHGVIVQYALARGIRDEIPDAPVVAQIGTWPNPRALQMAIGDVANALIAAVYLLDMRQDLHLEVAQAIAHSDYRDQGAKLFAFPQLPVEYAWPYFIAGDRAWVELGYDQPGAPTYPAALRKWRMRTFTAWTNLEVAGRLPHDARTKHLAMFPLRWKGDPITAAFDLSHTLRPAESHFPWRWWNNDTEDGALRTRTMESTEDFASGAGAQRRLDATLARITELFGDPSDVLTRRNSPLGAPWPIEHSGHRATYSPGEGFTVV